MVRRLVDRAAIIAMAAMAMIGWLSSGIGVPQGAAQTAGPVVPVTAGTVVTEDVPVFLQQRIEVQCGQAPSCWSENTLILAS